MTTDKLKVSMTPEDLSKALKWSVDNMEAQQAEIEQLRKLVEYAYTEGYNDRADKDMYPNKWWYTSTSYATLYPEKEENDN